MAASETCRRAKLAEEALGHSVIAPHSLFSKLPDGGIGVSDFRHGHTIFVQRKSSLKQTKIIKILASIWQLPIFK